MDTRVNSNIVAMTLENFQQIVMEDSNDTLVLVDFWAEQIPESVELKNKLTEKVSPFAEIMTLATVDCETQSQIAQQFSIQGLPTAVLVKDGQPIDGLTGPQTDESIAEFLDKYLPKVQDILLLQAKDLLAENKVTEALPVISRAYQLDATRADIQLVLADVYIQTGKAAEAETLLSAIKLVDQNSDYTTVMAKLELANQAANSPEIQALEAQVKADPDNIELQHQLAAQYSLVKRDEDALAILFRLVQGHGSDALSKQLLLDVLKTLPEGDALATKYRRKLYTLLY